MFKSQVVVVHVLIGVVFVVHCVPGFRTNAVCYCCGGAGGGGFAVITRGGKEGGSVLVSVVVVVAYFFYQSSFSLFLATMKYFSIGKLKSYDSRAVLLLLLLLPLLLLLLFLLLSLTITIWLFCSVNIWLCFQKTNNLQRHFLSF